MAKGIEHWLGKRPLEEAANQEWLDSIYPALRMRDPDAVAMCVKRHMRLTFKLCAKLAGSYKDTDELVSEGLYSLVHAVVLIANGAIDHHTPKPNIGGYIVQSVYGALNKLVMRKGLGRVSEQTFRKHKRGIPKTIVGASEALFIISRSPLKNLESKELYELLDAALSDERERLIVRLRLQGHSDVEIGQLLGVTTQRIQQIRTVIKTKILDLI